jgi:hypothetical protein
MTCELLHCMLSCLSALFNSSKDKNAQFNGPEIERRPKGNIVERIALT